MLNKHGISSSPTGQNKNHLEDSVCTDFKKISREKKSQDYNPLRLCGGAPGQDENCKPLAPITANHFNKILSAYQKAIDPRRQRPPGENGAPAYSLKLYTTSDESLDGTKSACGTPRCPSARLAYRPADSSLFGNSESQKSCGLSGCPFIKSETDHDTEKIAEFEALQRSATKIKSGSKCSSNFLPPIPPLKTIHWDCPDPLPDGPCQNPLCPLKPRECRDIPPSKGSCGTVKCPYSAPVICGDECPNNPPELLPYTPPPPPPPPPCPPPPCPPPPCYLPPPCPPPPCFLPHPCPPPPCFVPHPCPPPPPSCRNPRCPFSPPPASCVNPRCPFSPPPCPPKPPSCPNPRCPHSPPPPACPHSAPPRPPACPHSPPPRPPACPHQRCSH